MKLPFLSSLFDSKARARREAVGAFLKGDAGEVLSQIVNYMLENLSHGGATARYSTRKNEYGLLLQPADEYL